MLSEFHKFTPSAGRVIALMLVCTFLSRLTRNMRSLHESDGFLDEGLLRMMEAEGLVDDVRLRFDTHGQDRHRLLVSSVEKHL